MGQGIALYSFLLTGRFQTRKLDSLHSRCNRWRIYLKESQSWECTTSTGTVRNRPQSSGKHKRKSKKLIKKWYDRSARHYLNTVLIVPRHKSSHFRDTIVIIESALHRCMASVTIAIGLFVLIGHRI